MQNYTFPICDTSIVLTNKVSQQMFNICNNTFVQRKKKHNANAINNWSSFARETQNHHEYIWLQFSILQSRTGLCMQVGLTPFTLMIGWLMLCNPNHKSQIVIQVWVITRPTWTRKVPKGVKAGAEGWHELIVIVDRFYRMESMHGYLNFMNHSTK